MPNPVSRWQFEEGSGVVVNDSIGSLNGIFQGSTTEWSADAAKGGNAIVLDGIDRFIRITGAETVNFGTQQQFAIAFWVKTTSVTAGDLITKRDATGAFPYNVRMLANGTIAFSRNDGATTSQVVSFDAINDGAYHFITAVRASSELLIYIDGDLSSVAPDTTSAATINSAALQFGAGVGAAPLPFAGLLDDVRIYNTALCDTDVVAIMAEP